MGWSIGWDRNWQRDIGYGVPAYCDHPKCDEEIDRGLSYVCGNEPYGGERGCGLYFCSKHGGGRLCQRCLAYKPPYKNIKEEHPRWLAWKAIDSSWAKWRKQNRTQVAAIRAELEKRNLGDWLEKSSDELMDPDLW
jgi:hypothetical protein